MARRLHNNMVWLVIAVLALVCTACGGGGASVSGLAGTQPGLPAGTASGTAGAVQWPAALPVDAAQPWEQLDAQGHVVPGAAGHTFSSIDSNSFFAAGVERYLDGGSVTDLGEASTLSSDAAGGKQLSYAIYRLSLGAAQPGVVAADVNLRAQQGGAGLSQYYLGLSDYSRGRWEWHGPYSDSHVRVSTGAAVRGGAGYTSGLGDLFVCVVAYDGADFDVVGVGGNTYTAADMTAPPAPGGLTTTPVAQGLLLQWNGVIASDLAGYNIYWKVGAFSDPHAAGVQRLSYTEGLTRHVLLLPTTASYSVAVSAVDFSGNESAISPLTTGIPLAGDVPALQLSLSSVSVKRDEAVQLTASGAESYDFDLDGDGVFDLANTTGLANVDTSAPGLVRPLVRASNSGGSCQALGGVSLVVIGNTRPAVSALASPQSGAAPLNVSFTGEAEDQEDGPGLLSYAWDFDGDGTYEASTNTLTPDIYVYTASGTCNCRFRATDSQGAWAVASVAVQVGPGMASTDTVVYAHEVNYPTGLMVGGLAAMVFQRVSDTTLYYMRAQRPDATTWGAPVTVANPGGGISQPRVAIIAGNPAVIWVDGATGDVMFCRASTPQGSAWDAPVVVLNGAVDTYQNPQLIDAGGDPAIGFIRFSTGRPSFIRALASDGSAWGVATTIDGTASCYTALDLSIVEGNPAAVYTYSGVDETYYCQASDAQGSAWAAPVLVTKFIIPDELCLEVLDGTPSLALAEYATSAVYFGKATLSDGSVWDLPVPVVYRIKGNLWARGLNLRSLDGVPTLAFNEIYHGSTYFCQAVDASAEFWHEPVTLCPRTPVEYTYGEPTYFVLNGVPNIIHINHQPEMPNYEIRDTRYYP